MSTGTAIGTTVDLTRKERTVLTDALDYYIDEEADDQHVERLEQHAQTAAEDSIIRVQPGEEELFQKMFRGYAVALQQTVGDDVDTEAMGDFFESVFKSIVDKIRDAGGPAGLV